MSSTTRFPSGATVDQVKKDARAIAKAEGIPRHQALDKAAAKHGLPLTWNRAISQLSTVQADTIATFSLQSVDGPVELVLSREKPFGVLVGAAGSGKSVLSGLMAESYLATSKMPLHWVTAYWANTGSDLTSLLWQRVVRKGADQVHTHSVEARYGSAPFSLAAMEHAPQPGSLFIVDETAAVLGANNVEQFFAPAWSLKVGTIFIVQHPNDLAGLPPEQVGFMLFAEGGGERSFPPRFTAMNAGQVRQVAVEDISAIAVK